MKRTIGLALASGLAFLVAGCAAGGGGGTGASPGSDTQATADAQTKQQAAANSGVRDFNLQVKCPGIHLEKSKLKWDDDKIESHENVTAEEIANCEAFTASQPKGYVPPPPGGAATANAGGGASSGGAAPAKQ